MARAESHQARPEEAQEPSSSLPQGGSLITCCGASACLTALDRLASLTTHTPRIVSLLVTNCRARAVAHSGEAPWIVIRAGVLQLQR